LPSPREVLIDALKDVDEADVPEDLREIAFAKAFDLRAGTVVPAVQNLSHGTQGAGRASADGSSSGASEPDTDDLLTNVAERLKIDRGTVAEVFTAHDGVLELITSPTKLPDKAATGTKEIALLIAGVRQAAGIDEWTSTDEIRKACIDYKKYDSPNFAKTIREMGDVFNYRKESERKVLVRLAKPGWERLAAVIKRLAGE
jgi:hypothetical protein